MEFSRHVEGGEEAYKHHKGAACRGYDYHPIDIDSDLAGLSRDCREMSNNYATN